LGWLGYYAGNSYTLKHLCIYSMAAETIGVHRLGDFIEGLSRNRSIETLYIGADIGGTGFRQMGDFFRNNNNLRELSFGSMEMIGVESARSIAFMLRQSQQSHLRELSFEESNASEEVLAEILTAISTHSLLEELNLYDNNLGRDGSVALGNALKACNNPQLKKLYLGQNSIDDEGLQGLVEGMRNCHNLSQLDLSCNDSITVDGCRSLCTLFQSEHCQLKYLGLESMNIESDGAAALAAGLTSLNQLENLNLSENSIGDDGVSALAAGIANLHLLEDLDLDGNSTGDLGLQALAESLLNCDNNLKYLSLTNNAIISASGLRSLSILLGSDSCSLTTLGLGGVSFGDEGAVALADGLKDNRSMKHVHLSNNSIGDLGLQALVGGLVNCDDLKVLSLSGNRSITASGLRSLSTLLQFESCSLVNVCLERIPFGDDGAVALADALKGNKSMERLHFNPDSTGIASVGWSAFSKLLCDTSSVNNTYLSNHSLKQIGDWSNEGTTDDVKALLALNKQPAEHVAIHKILNSHPDFDIEPFFEWKLKLLPFVISWFDRVRTLVDVDDHKWISDESAEEIQSRQLSTMHNFIRGMPLLAIDGYRSRNNAAVLAPSRKRKIEQLGQ
jgi:Ran GTPase-activating protein (RanGAP) involved in mRNA processing and transport